MKRIYGVLTTCALLLFGAAGCEWGQEEPYEENNGVFEENGEEEENGWYEEEEED